MVCWVAQKCLLIYLSRVSPSWAAFFSKMDSIDTICRARGKDKNFISK